MNLRNAALLLALTAALTAVVFFRPHAMPGPPMRDFDAYYAAGAAANSGANPYSLQVARFEHGPLLPFVSPPVVVPLFCALAHVPPTVAVIVWRVLLIACIAGIVIVLLRLCGHTLSLRTLAAGACIAAGFGPLTSALALGQLALPAYAAAILALIAPPAAFFVWMQPNFALSVLGQARWKPALWCLAGLIAAVAFSSRSYAAALRDHTASERYSAIQLAPQAVVYGFGAPPVLADALGTITALIAAMGILTAIIRLRRPLQSFAVASVLMPFIVPFAHEHNVIVAFYPAMAALLLAPSRYWIIAGLAAVLCAVDWLGLAQRPDGMMQTVLLTFAFVAAAWGLREDISVRSGAVVIMSATLAIVAAAVIAYPHPMPVWPDAMPPLRGEFASPAQQWHAEQAATGLFARDAVWSALRALTLLGCAALAYMSTFIMSSNGESAPG